MTKRHFNVSDVNDTSSLPSWSETKSAKITVNVKRTTIVFTLMLPYPATEYVTNHTSMLNFQDVIIQTPNICGAFWSDDNIYRLVQEMKLLFPQTFRNIFLGLGSFHMEKNL